MPVGLISQIVVELGIIAAMTFLLVSRRGRQRLAAMAPRARSVALIAYALGVLLVLADIITTVLRTHNPRP